VVRGGLGVHAEIVCAPKDGLCLILTAVLAEEVRPLQSCFAGICAARVHSQEIDRAAVRVVRPGFVALQRKTARKGTHRVPLLFAMEVSKQSERVARALDREIGVTFKSRES
jgi:hypothetical protein